MAGLDQLLLGVRSTVLDADRPPAIKLGLPRSRLANCGSTVVPFPSFIQLICCAVKCATALTSAIDIGLTDAEPRQLLPPLPWSARSRWCECHQPMAPLKTTRSMSGKPFSSVRRGAPLCRNVDDHTLIRARSTDALPLSIRIQSLQSVDFTQLKTLPTAIMAARADVSETRCAVKASPRPKIPADSAVSSGRTISPYRLRIPLRFSLDKRSRKGAACRIEDQADLVRPVRDTRSTFLTRERSN